MPAPIYVNAIGTDEYLQVISTPLSKLEGGEVAKKFGITPFSDLYKEGNSSAESIEQNSFYSGVLSKVFHALQRLSADPSATPATILSVYEIVAGDGSGGDHMVHVDSLFPKHAEELTFATDFISDKVLKRSTVNTFMAMLYPRFLWEIYDIMRFTEAKSEYNKYKYLSYVAIDRMLVNANVLGANIKDKLTHAMTRWWVFYTFKALEAEMKTFANDFVVALDLKTATMKVDNRTAAKAAYEVQDRIRRRIEEVCFAHLEENTASKVIDFMRVYLDEVSAIRHATSEPASLRFKIDTLAADPTQKYKIIKFDRSKTWKFISKIANSVGYQLYSRDAKGELVSELNMIEISEFYTRAVAFSEGEGKTKTYIPADFYGIAFDPHLFIDTGHVKAYINENGFALPYSVEGFNITFNAPTKSLLFSHNSQNAMPTAMTLDEYTLKKMNRNIHKGADIVNLGDAFEFRSSYYSEMALHYIQRFWALVIPKTSATGTPAIQVDNAWGLPALRRSYDLGQPWMLNGLSDGLMHDVYFNTAPVISFMQMLHMDDFFSSIGENDLIIGSKLAKLIYTVLRHYGIEELKSKMLDWNNELPQFPAEQMLPQWTSSVGQAHALDHMKGYGDMYKEAQCIKSVWSFTSSVQMLRALTKTLALIVSYKTSDLPAVGLLSEIETSIAQD